MALPECELAQALLTKAGQVHTETAFFDEPSRWTYGRFRREVLQAQELFAQQGIRPRQRVLLRAPTTPWTFVAQTALMSLGASVVLMGANLPEPMALLRQEVSKAHYVVSPSSAERGEPFSISPQAQTQPLSPKGFALGLFTSGSSGRPKLVMHSSAGVLTSARCVQRYLDITAQDRLWLLLPPAFGYGQMQVLPCLLAGAQVGFGKHLAFVAQVAEDIGKHEVTLLGMVPTLVELFLELGKEELRWEKLRAITNAGDRLSVDRLERLAAALPRCDIFSMYGQTECFRATYAKNPHADSDAAHVGSGLEHQKAWVVGKDGAPLPHGETGELVLGGPHLMLGYFNQPELAADKLRPGPDGSLCLFTGDEFRFQPDAGAGRAARHDAPARWHFVGRSDEMINCRGQKISPRETEQVIARWPEVKAVAVVGVNDDREGQVLAAHVVWQGEPLAKRELRKRLRASLEAPLHPRHWVTRTELPRNARGKVVRRLLGAPTDGAAP